MNRSKESQIYLSFFIDSLPIILVFGLLTLIATLFYLNSQPNKFIVEADWQMSYQEQNLGDRMNLTDQAVSLVRSQVLQNKIGVEKSDNIKIYKSGPLLINLTDSGGNKDLLNMDIKNVDNFLTANFPLSSVGQPIIKPQPKPFLIFGLISFLAGSLVGLLVCLTKSYLKNY